MSFIFAVLAGWLQPDDAERNDTQNAQLVARAQASYFLGESHSLEKQGISEKFIIYLNDILDDIALVLYSSCSFKTRDCKETVLCIDGGG